MKKYENYTKEQLIQKIKQLESKKYGLVWDDEKEPEKVVVECLNNIPILTKIDDKTIKTDIKKPTNILIEGDNYHALQVLNYTHKGQIDVIYIDPPYNTGNKDFKYNDTFVDKEDGYRHSKWLNFMSKRLNLAHNLLKDSGVIFISIDDNEVAQLKLLCDDIFGEKNFVTTIHWRRSESQNNNSKTLSVVAEYILCYTKNMVSLPIFNKLEHTDKAKKEYRYKDNKGLFRRGTIIDKSRGSNNFEIILSDGNKIQIKNSIRTKEWFLAEVSKSMIYWTKTNTPYWKIYLDKSDGQIASNWFDNIAVNEDASDEISSLGLNFSFSKPKELIIYLLKLVNFNQNSTILDFFAGSGTTGHAVLELNQEDGGNRQFILSTNNENSICEEVTYPRISKVINGYTTSKGIDIDGISGNLDYYKTDLISTNGISNITDSVREELTKKAGNMIAVKENTHLMVELCEHYQIFINEATKKQTAIYFTEDLSYFAELIEKTKAYSTKLYIFSFGKIDKSSYKYLGQNYQIEDIPEPIIEIYKEINKEGIL